MYPSPRSVCLPCTVPGFHPFCTTWTSLCVRCSASPLRGTNYPSRPTGPSVFGLDFQIPPSYSTPQQLDNFRPLPTPAGPSRRRVSSCLSGPTWDFLGVVGVSPPSRPFPSTVNGLLDLLWVLSLNDTFCLLPGSCEVPVHGD